MTRVSLTEDYDDRSVISKLNEMDKRVKENASVVTSAEESARQSAQSAQETADRFAGSVGAVVQNANQQINSSKAQVDSAKAEVDETVNTVAQAVTTANQASASAQRSAQITTTMAQTITGYNTRLTAVEDKAQGNSADIDHLEIETRDLYDRDANSMKLEGTQTVLGQQTFLGKDNDTPIIIKSRRVSSDTGVMYNVRINSADGVQLGDFASYKGTQQTSNYLDVYRNSMRAELGVAANDAAGAYGFATTPPLTAPSNAIATKGYVEATDGVTNNLVHKTGNEIVPAFKYSILPVITPTGSAQATTRALIYLGKRTATNDRMLNFVYGHRTGCGTAHINVSMQALTATMAATVTGNVDFDLGLVDANGDVWLTARRKGSAGSIININLINGMSGASSAYPTPVNEVPDIADYLSTYVKIGEI